MSSVATISAMSKPESAGTGTAVDVQVTVKNTGDTNDFIWVIGTYNDLSFNWESPLTAPMQIVGMEFVAPLDPVAAGAGGSGYDLSTGFCRLRPGYGGVKYTLRFTMPSEDANCYVHAYSWDSGEGDVSSFTVSNGSIPADDYPHAAIQGWAIGVNAVAGEQVTFQVVIYNSGIAAGYVDCDVVSSQCTVTKNSNPQSIQPGATATFSFTFTMPSSDVTLNATSSSYKASGYEDDQTDSRVFPLNTGTDIEPPDTSSTFNLSSLISMMIIVVMMGMVMGMSKKYMPNPNK